MDDYTTVCRKLFWKKQPNEIEFMHVHVLKPEKKLK